ncbi:AraC family transcriptional regulator [Microbulbifer litoralis]|uniref:AraC family transcriptional regulator n=1 Tax=Microbulbifer litoralis TaxID=2933965 RepID=UPI00202885F0|nr:AraC family transcriptional regulator [Microbulbifer sp. GX H0434]
MNLDSALVPLHRHPLGFIEAFCNLGARQQDLLDGTGISPAMFGMQRACISYRQLQRLFHNGIHLCPQPDLGLAVGMQFDWSFWGPVGFTVYCSPSLRHAGEAFRRYMVTAQPYFATHAAEPNSYLDADNRVVEPIDYTTGSDEEPVLRDFIREFRLAITLRIWDLCGNKSVADPSVRVRIAAPSPAEYSYYDALPCDSLTFGCDSNSISAHADYVFQPFRPLRRRTFDSILRLCERELARVPAAVTFADRVRWHIRAHFRPDLDLKAVAAQLQLTPRSLSRRLAREEESFRDLLHRVRMEIASHHLCHSQLPVEQVAEIAGFSCASSLRRAVKNWSGLTIGQIRDSADAV